MQYIQTKGRYVSRAFTLLLLAIAVLLCAPFMAHADTNTQAAGQNNSQALTTQGSAGKTTNAVAAIIVGDEPTIKGGAQTIGVVLNDENATLASGRLFATNIATSKVISTDVVKAQGNVAVFTFESPGSGTYYVSKLRYKVAGSSASYEQSFTMDDANVFSVSSVGTSTISDDDVVVSVYDLDENGTMVDSTALATTIQQTSIDALTAGTPTVATPPVSSKQSASGPASIWAPANGADPLSYKFVIAIDPGHGGHDSGAADNGLKEKDINLKIAKACAQELEKYQNIEVYLTRDTDVFVGLETRVINAKKKGARVFVSIHINAAGSAGSSARGTEVYYPIGSAYLKNKTHGMGKVVAQGILDELLGLGLGLTNRGIVTRETSINDKYVDGSKSDYYSVIRNSRSRGIPGLIVEHAFITNAAEAKIMKSDANLAKMGKADATGIAKAYNFFDGYWYKDNGTWKYWDGQKYVKSKWLYRAGTWYYFDGNETPVTGLQKINGVWYYFDKTTFANVSGWVQDGGKWYYGRSDNAVKESWSLKSGWLKLDAWYYFDPNAEGYPAKTGLFTVDGVQYYAGSDCRMVANKDITVDGVTYHAAASGALTKKGAAVVSTGEANASNLAGKWEKWPSGWYFKKSNGEYATGLFSPKGDSRWYYCNSKGLMKTGWVKVSGKWYYANSNGAMASGWKKLKGKWYYLDPKTKAHPAVTGFFSDGKARYYTDPTSCAMKTGWIKVGNKWYWTKGSGALQSGWIKLSGKWYYLDPAQTNYPAKQDEIFTVNDVQYYVDSSCALVVNKDVTVDGTKYHAAASGALTALATGKTVSTTKSTTSATDDYDIMGKPNTTVAKMVAAYNKTGNEYPASTYKAKGAATIDEFCQILYDEAVAEGVRPEVVFAQSMLETGWLRFGGSVKVSQCNFAGIGATDSNPKPATFKDVQEGLRAQVQHLKAYASKDALKNTCVDPRFNLVTRGCAPTVKGLSGRWATGSTYGDNIINIMKSNSLI